MRKSRSSLIFLLIVGAFVAAFINPVLALGVVLGGLAVLFLARHLDFGLIILVFFFPYLGLVIDFSAFEFLQDVPYIKNVNAPFIDLYALVLFVSWGLFWIFKLNLKTLPRQLPFFKSYLLFWLSGLVSIIKVPSVYFYSSLKYFARPFTFCYLVFFVPIVDIVTRDKKLLERVLWVFFATGLLSALNGLLGLIFGAQGEFPRATPFGLFGVSPLGPNHNLLAETLIATAPVGLILMMRYALHSAQRHWITYGMWLQWAVALLTFARTAWIAVFVQAIIYIYLTHRKRLRTFLKGAAPAIVLLAIMALLLIGTTFTETVRGSTLSRLDQMRIAAFYFERTPLVGQGVGTFLPTLWQTKAFLLEYGDPLEAHGVIFKLMFEQGLFGLIAFGVLMGMILYVIGRTLMKVGEEKRPLLIAALLIAVGSLTYQLFNTTYYTSKLWVPLAIAIAIAKVYEHHNSNSTLVS